VGSGGSHAISANAGGDSYFCNSTSNCTSIAGSAVVVGAQGGSGGADPGVGTGQGGGGGGALAAR